MRALLLSSALLLALATPAGALSFAADVLVTPESGASFVLSGSLDIAVGGSLPPAGNVSFDVVGLSVSGSGFDVELDSSSGSPGLGVLSPTGSWLVPNLLLTVEAGGPPQALTATDAQGQVVFDGDDIAALQGGFFLELGGELLVVSVNAVRALPEPGSGLLLASVGVWIARRRQR